MPTSPLLRRNILILVCVVLLVYAGNLFNGFVGDDEIIFEGNRFYQSLSHLPHLFTKFYFPHPESVRKFGGPFYSGSVAYRPVLSLTYFFDYTLWGPKPFGFHLTNTVLHILNVLLVYAIVAAVAANTRAALLAALLFGVHPVQAEAVSAIGYRADVLAAFFVLSAFLCYLKGRPRSMLALFFLGLFAKESAVVFPLLVWVYDRGRRTDHDRTRSPIKGLFLVLAFYLCVYLFVFPNKSLAQSHWLGGSFGAHVAIMVWIFARYMIDLILPFAVKIIPPLYAPEIYPSLGAKMVLGSAFVLLCLRGVFSRSREVSFFMSWFLIALIPVANIIPLANSMAHRFLYLPSAGLMAVFALGIDRGLHKIPARLFPNLPALCKIALVGLCGAMTVSLSSLWANTIYCTQAMIRQYPDHAKLHSVLAMEYLFRGEKERAKEYFNRAIALHSKDPRDYQHFGVLLYDEEPEEAARFFEAHPRFGSPYVMLGRLGLYTGQYEEALEILEKGYRVKPTFAMCAYLVQIYNRLGRVDDAMNVIEETKDLFHEQGRDNNTLRALLSGRLGSGGLVDFGVY